MIIREYCAICTEKAFAAICKGCLNEAVAYDREAEFEEGAD